tara:strand:- start:219 stop:1061 length:843 start_codon:yes stop_codon:yes gene_type:complete
MIYLLLSIVASTLIFVIFNLFHIYKITTVKAIVINYITAFTFGFLVFQVYQNHFSYTELGLAIGLGILFFTLFNVMGLTTQKFGVTIASISTKMSLIFPVLIGSFIYNDSLNLFQWIAVVLAIISIWMVNYQKGTKQSTSQRYLPVILFIGSGVLDSLVDLASRFVIESNNESFSTLIFGSAATVGLSFLGLKRNLKFEKKELIGGFTLGIINFFSIYLILEALDHAFITRSLIFPINNVSIIAFSALLGYWIFKEQKTKLNWGGVFVALCSILLFAFSR